MKQMTFLDLCSGISCQFHAQLYKKVECNHSDNDLCSYNVVLGVQELMLHFLLR